MAKKRFYASVMMTALVMLHVALASISPLRLFDTIANGGVDSYIRAMDISNVNSLVTNPDNRPRLRGRSVTLSDLPVQCAMLAVSFVDGALPLMAKLFALDAWNRLIGLELSTKPHADMVSRK
jgi:hypothetical protein